MKHEHIYKEHEVTKKMKNLKHTKEYKLSQIHSRNVCRWMVVVFVFAIINSVLAGCGICVSLHKPGLTRKSRWLRYLSVMSSNEWLLRNVLR